MLSSFSVIYLKWTEPFLRSTRLDRFNEESVRSSSPLAALLEKMIARRTSRLFVRGVLLFLVGMFFALVLNLLQVQRQVTLFPDVGDSAFSSTWWLLLCCGAASAAIGLLYPYFDEQLGESECYKQEWSSVMKCIAVFVGINHASAKIDFANNLQLSLTLSALSIGLWWIFDRSRSGFGLGVGVAVLATLVSQFLVYYGIYRCAVSDSLYVRSSLPCIFFSGGITMGNIGRQLATADYVDVPVVSASKEHDD